jgi:hypothetical protein
MANVAIPHQPLELRSLKSRLAKKKGPKEAQSLTS